MLFSLFHQLKHTVTKMGAICNLNKLNFKRKFTYVSLKNKTQHLVCKGLRSYDLSACKCLISNHKRTQKSQETQFSLNFTR